MRRRSIFLPGMTARQTRAAGRGKGKTIPTLPVDIYLRHPTAPLWFSAKGRWLSSRRNALRFKTSIEAVVACVDQLRPARLVGFDACGGEVYNLDVRKVVGRLVH